MPINSFVPTYSNQTANVLLALCLVIRNLALLNSDYELLISFDIAKFHNKLENRYLLNERYYFFS